MHCVLRCCRCGQTYSDHRLACDYCPDALLRSVYADKRFRPTDEEGIFRYRCWLPSDRGVPTRIGPCVLEAGEFGRRLGLQNLYLAFNGYWPERGAWNITGSFKDHEAAPTLTYFREHGCKQMVISSVGNTARAFAHACTEARFPCCIVIPSKMLHRLWLPRPAGACVRALVLRDSCDYTAAIHLGEKIRARFNVMVEGGARNVARRDGMGTSVLEFARQTGKLPDHYVQAIGSGTGAIAAYEASLRLRDDGRFGDRLPRLQLVQNAPFVPIHEAWQAGRDKVAEEATSVALEKVQNMYADVLANSKPPYSLVGGVRDALGATAGKTYAVTNEDARRTKESFEAQHDVDLNEPASCACAGLIQAVARGEIRPHETVLLNLTGGGYRLIARDYRLYKMQPTQIIGPGDVDFARVEKYEDLFQADRRREAA